MRRVLYVATLAAVWLAAMGIGIMWLASSDGRLRLVLVAVGYWAAVSTIALVEEFQDLRQRRDARTITRLRNASRLIPAPSSASSSSRERIVRKFLALEHRSQSDGSSASASR
jgi:hypothetical protein